MKYLRALLLSLFLFGAGKLSAQLVTPEMLAGTHKVCEAARQMDAAPGYAGGEEFDSARAAFFSELESFLSIPRLPLQMLADSLCIRAVKSPDGRFITFTFDERTGGTFKSCINYEVEIDNEGIHFQPYNTEFGGGESGLVRCDTIQVRGKVYYFSHYWASVSSSMASTEITITDGVGEFRESLSWYYCTWMRIGSMEASNEYDPVSKSFHHQHAEPINLTLTGEPDFSRMDKDGIFSDPTSVKWDTDGKPRFWVSDTIDIRQLIQTRLGGPKDK